MRRIVFAAIFSAVSVSLAWAEDVEVKYRGFVPLDSFECRDIDRSSLVKRVCYDADQRYMVINLKGIYYHYCEIPPDILNGMLSAASIGKYYSENIKGKGSDGPFDCRTHVVPPY